MRQALILLPLALGACAEPMIRDSDVIRTARDPAYTYGQSGVIVPSSCSGRGSTYSGTPSGCQRDLVFATQVMNPADLVAPVPSRLGSAGAIGRAADAYISPAAAPPIDSALAGPQPAQGRRLPLPLPIAADPYGAARGY